MRAKPYPKDKPSAVEWLDDVPDHWNVTRGRYCMQVNPPSTRLHEMDPEDEVSLVPMEMIGEYGGINLERSCRIGETGSSYTEFENGDVVVAKITPCFENGKGALAVGLLNGAAYGTSELHVLRALDAVERRFLFYVTMSSIYRKAGEAQMYGAGGQKRVPSEFNSDYRFVIPPKDEQTAISDFLDLQTGKLDALVAKKRALIERLAEKRTALISRTVTRGLPPDVARAAGLDPHPKLKSSGVDWIGDVPVHWKIKKFSREVRIAEGQVDPEAEPYANMLLVAPNHIESQTGRMLSSETATDQGAESGKYFSRKGEVLYSKIRPALAKVTIAPEDCLCSADMYPMSGKGAIDNGYLRWLILSKQFTAWSVLEADRVAMPKINRETLNELRIPVPPVFEQHAIAHYLDRESAKNDRMVAKIEAAIERLMEYRGALITAAVTGKIDVRAAGSQSGIVSGGQ